MKSTLSLNSNASATDPALESHFSEYLARQHPIVRGLHAILSAISICFIILVVVTFGIALYYTLVWAISGNHTLLDDAWVAFGMASSLMVFPWGLDSMLMRTFPAIIFPSGWYRSTRPIHYKTGLRYIFAGFGVMCAGAPGFAYYLALLSEALTKLF